MKITFKEIEDLVFNNHLLLKEVATKKGVSNYLISKAISDYESINEKNKERVELLREKLSDITSEREISKNRPIKKMPRKIDYSKELKIILPLIRDGLSKTKISTVTGLSMYVIDRTIDYLKATDPILAKEIEDLILVNGRTRTPDIPDSEYKNYIGKIESAIRDGKYDSELPSIVGLSNEYIDRIFNALNNSNSSIYNPKKYDELVSIKMANKLSHTKEHIAKINNYYFSKTKEQASKIINGEYTISEIVTSTSNPIDTLSSLGHIYDEKLNADLEPFFLNYSLIGGNKEKRISNFSNKVLKEIVLVALTYRVSLKNLSILFNTDILDICDALKNLDYLMTALNHLFIETENEDEISSKRALFKAKEYYQKRNKYVKMLNDAKRKCDYQKQKEAKVLLDKLYLEINDKPLHEALEKDMINLTSEERDLIAQYQLKYYLSDRKCCELLKINKETLASICASYAERNPIYAEKKDIHYAFFYEQYNNLKKSK